MHVIEAAIVGLFFTNHMNNELRKTRTGTQRYVEGQAGNAGNLVHAYHPHPSPAIQTQTMFCVPCYRMCHSPICGVFQNLLLYLCFIRLLRDGSFEHLVPLRGSASLRCFAALNHRCFQ